MPNTATRQPATKATRIKENTMTQTANLTAETAAPIAAIERVYVAQHNDAQLAVGVNFKEARKLLWRAAKSDGVVVPPTPREFFQGTGKPDRSWQKKAKGNKYTILEVLAEPEVEVVVPAPKSVKAATKKPAAKAAPRKAVKK